MKILRPTEVNKLQDCEEVYVNRITINSRLVELNLQENANDEAKKILYHAVRDIMMREKDKRTVVWGVKMTLGDIRRAFGTIEQMGATSFAIFGSLTKKEPNSI